MDESHRSQGLHEVQPILGSGRHVSDMGSEGKTLVQSDAKNLGVGPTGIGELKRVTRGSSEYSLLYGVTKVVERRSCRERVSPRFWRGYKVEKYAYRKKKGWGICQVSEWG